MAAQKVVAQRYRNLVDEIDRIHPRRILEIGTCAGVHAEMMIRAAQRHHSNPRDVEYFGYDLFAPAPAHEHTPRTVAPHVDTVYSRLKATGASVTLIKGDTRITLNRDASLLPIMDFVFIDGGHSTETVASDWAAVQEVMGPDTVVIFDDYWNWPEGGANAVVDALPRSMFDVALLDPVDVLPRANDTELRTQFARIMRTLP